MVQSTSCAAQNGETRSPLASSRARTRSRFTVSCYGADYAWSLDLPKRCARCMAVTCAAAARPRRAMATFWRGHDVEAFRAEVARYGAWTADLADFAATMREQA